MVSKSILVQGKQHTNYNCSNNNNYILTFGRILHHFPLGQGFTLANGQMPF